MNFQKGRKILTLLTFGCPTYNQKLSKITKIHWIFNKHLDFCNYEGRIVFMSKS